MSMRKNHFFGKSDFFSYVTLYFYLIPNHILYAIFPHDFLWAMCPEVCSPLSVFGNLIYFIVSVIGGYLISNTIIGLFKK